MPVVGEVITVKIPVPHAFNYLSEPENLAEFWPNLSDINYVDSLPDDKEGYEWKYKFAGISLHGLAEITGLVPNKLLIIETRGDIYSILTWSFSHTDEGTRVSCIFNYEAPGLNLNEQTKEVLVKRIERQISRLMSNLRDKFSEY